MLRVGTASWTDESLLQAGWYPASVKSKSAERLLYCAERFDTAELDATYYALIADKVFENWSRILPEKFIMHVKAFARLTMLPSSTTLPAADSWGSMCLAWVLASIIWVCCLGRAYSLLVLSSIPFAPGLTRQPAGKGLPGRYR